MAFKAEIKDYLQAAFKKQEKRPATNTRAGLMSAADKAKLDNIQFDFDSGTLRFFTSKGILTFTADGRNSN